MVQKILISTVFSFRSAKVHQRHNPGIAMAKRYNIQMGNLLRRFRQAISRRNKIRQAEKLPNRDEMDQDYQTVDLTWENWRMGTQLHNRMSSMFPENKPNLNEASNFAALPFRRFALVEEMEKHIFVQPNSIREWRRVMVVRERLREFHLL